MTDRFESRIHAICRGAELPPWKSSGNTAMAYASDRFRKVLNKVVFHRFKQLRDVSVDLKPSGVTLVAGGNNSGKSSLLHGLAIWEFCRTAIEMKRGLNSFFTGSLGQGLGLGDDEFSPIAIPSLKHLWTNLKTQRDGEPDGYTLKIACHWTHDGHDKRLEFGLSLANDRLFVKATDSNLTEGDYIPRVAYLPPFAGITAREHRVHGALRRRRIGEGLAGAVLRNILLDLFEANRAKRSELRGGKSKISDPDLKNLRDTDPWELLQGTLREVFSAELIVDQFKEEYHSYIQVNIVKGTVDGYKLRRHPNYNPRDLMVEGSGLLQWLSVYTLATSPDISALLYDEPDAHLHVSLQDRLISILERLATKQGKQVLLATHSSELLRHSAPSSILEIRGSTGGRYLTKEHQKIGLLAGLGTEYAPKIDQAKHRKRVLFVEGRYVDARILQIFASKLSIVWPDRAVIWPTVTNQRERKLLFTALKEEIPELVAISLRDRDDAPIETVGDGLLDKSIEPIADLFMRKWRRRNVESYLLWPAAMGAAIGTSEADVRTRLADEFGLAIGGSFTQSNAPQALLNADGKQILAQFGANAIAVVEEMPVAAIGDDVRQILEEILERLGDDPEV